MNLEISLISSGLQILPVVVVEISYLNLLFLCSRVSVPCMETFDLGRKLEVYYSSDCNG